MLLKVADVIIGSEEMLSQADRDTGDGDHGLGMQRGFTAAKAQLEGLDPKTVAEGLYGYRHGLDGIDGRSLRGSYGNALPKWWHGPGS